MDKRKFRRCLSAWFRRHGRDLPWRRTRDPYAILVSEIMLQQTTVAAVVPYYERWMKKYPTLQVLAKAEESDVLALWQGLGYYRRVRNFVAAATKVRKEMAGVFPQDYAGLRSLPGVGDYTAQAVLAFAYDKPVPVLDANIIRVVARLFDVRVPVDATGGLKIVRSHLEEILPSRGGRNFISALMDLGATVCRAGEPRCGVCPVKPFCAARHPDRLPIKSAKAPIKARAEHAAWMSDGGNVLLQQAEGRRWRGLWRLPPLESAPVAEPAATLGYSIVRERVTLNVYRLSRRALGRSAEPRRMFAFEELAHVAIPSPHRRAIAKMLERDQKSVRLGSSVVKVSP